MKPELRTEIRAKFLNELVQGTGPGQAYPDRYIPLPAHLTQ